MIWEVFGERFETFRMAHAKFGKVPIGTAYNRLSRGGMSVEDCLTMPRSEAHVRAALGCKVTVNGKQYKSSITAWEAECRNKRGISLVAFQRRLKHLNGRTVEQALTLSHLEWSRAK